MSFIVKESGFYRKFFSMTGVIALQNLITFSVNLADNIMIGGYSQAALSGVAMVNQIQFLLQMIITGIGSGIIVLGAQYWGQHEISSIRKITSFGLIFGMGVGLLLSAVVALFPRGILSLLTNETEVIDEGVKYLKIVCFSYVFFAITNVLLAALRSVETVRIGFAVTLTALVVNVFLNYGLIYGRMGFPEMGIEGAAVATFVSRIVEVLVIVTYVLCGDRKLHLRPRDLFSADRVLLRDFIHVSSPLILSGTLWGVAMSIQAAILGRLGEKAIAANSIATTLFQVISVITYASANTSSVMIGMAVGQRDMQRVRVYTRTMQLLYLLIGLVTGSLMLLSRDFILRFYSITPETQVISKQFINVLAVTVIGTSYQVACMTGIVTGGGDTRFALINDIIFQWFVVIPLSFASAFWFHAPLWVTFFCLKSDQITKCIPAFIKVNRYTWIKLLTRDPAHR